MSETKLKTQQALGGNGWVNPNESWSYSSADAPTFVITVPSGAASRYSVGMRIKLTQTTVKYFIITAVADTALTVYGGTDYTLANAAITDNFYSMVKAPLGFPLSPAKWTVTGGSDSGQTSPTSETYYNIGGSIDIPIGAWIISYGADYVRGNSGSDNIYIYLSASLSTSNNTAVFAYRVSSRIYLYGTSRIRRHDFSPYLSKQLVLTTKDTYYLNFMVQFDTAMSDITVSGAYISAVCAYL